MNAAKNILFIRTHDRSVSRAVTHPLGCIHLAAYVRQQRPDYYAMRVFHAGLHHRPHEDLRALLGEFPPDYVVMTVLTPEITFMNSLIRTVKQLAPGCRVLLGGPYPSSMPEHAASQKDVDAVGIGEGELTLVELLDTYEHGGDLAQVRGIAYLDGETVRTTAHREAIQDLDSLPRPAWDLIDMQVYRHQHNMSNTLRGYNYASLFTSRGCPYRCTYCHSIQGKSFRAMSPPRMLEELLHLHDTYGIDEFHVMDDIFNFDRERLHAFCRLVIASGRRFYFAFPNGVRTDRFKPEDIDLLEQAGTYKMCFAIETRTERIQKAIKKNNIFPKIEPIISYTSKTRIIASSFFMLGFPTETREELEETIRWAVASYLDAGSFFQVIPYPGSELEGWAVQENAALADTFNFKPEKYHFSSGFSATTHLTHEELTLYLLTAYLRFYFRPSRLWRLWWKIPRKWPLFYDLMLIIKYYLTYCLNMDRKRSLNVIVNPQLT